MTEAEEATVVAFRRHTLLRPDDCLYPLQPSVPHLTRSALHRCLQRHSISRLPDVEGDKPKRQRFKPYPIGFFYIDIVEVQTAEGKLYLFVAIDRTSKFAFARLVTRTTGAAARLFLDELIAVVPYRIHTPYRQWHPVRRSAEEPLWSDCQIAWVSMRPHLPKPWHRAPPDKAQTSMDQRPSQTDEPNHQGGNRETVACPWKAVLFEIGY